MSKIEERYRIEEAFHDELAHSTEATFYDFGALDAPDAYLWSLLGDLRGARVLEIGCGAGETTIALCRAGASVTALDISAEMIRVTRERAEAAGFGDRVRAVHGKVEECEFARDSFDVVYGHSVLHHLELATAIPRIAAALRPQGRAAFLDPLDHNVVLNLMRRLTPNIRTPTEKPLTKRDIAWISTYFASCERREFHLASIAAFTFWYVIRSERLFRASLAALSRLDRILFRVLPFSRDLSWVTVLSFRK